MHKQLVLRVWRTVIDTPKIDPKNSLELRIRLQKIVYLAQKLLRLPTNVTFGLYIHGPYSPALADIYYSPTFPSALRVAEPLEGEAAEKLRRLWALDTEDLELAATYFDLLEKLRDEETTARRVAMLKGVTKERVKEAVTRVHRVLEPLERR